MHVSIRTCALRVADHVWQAIAMRTNHRAVSFPRFYDERRVSCGAVTATQQTHIPVPTDNQMKSSADQGGRQDAGAPSSSASSSSSSSSSSFTRRRSRFDYDVIIIGGGPAGSNAVSICTWLNKRVCVIEPRGYLWPAPTGAVSKIHRTCGLTHGDSLGRVRVPWSVVDDHLAATLDRVRRLPLPHDSASPSSPALPSSVTVVKGFGRLKDVNTVEVRSAPAMCIVNDGADDGGILHCVTADVILLASGSVPARLPSIPFDGKYVFDSDDIAQIGRTPHKIVVQGAGVIGIE